MPDLVYTNDFQRGTYRLVELGSKELEDCLTSGQELVIKGLPEDQAVLCTPDKTFSVVQVNTSNSMLLAQPRHDGTLAVTDDLTSTIELIPSQARLQRIDALLETTLYAGPDAEQGLLPGKTLYTRNDLEQMIQASAAELEHGLKDRHVFELNGFCRMLDPSYAIILFDALITNAVIHNVDATAMQTDDAMACMRLYQRDPDPVLAACLTSTCDPVQAGWSYNAKRAHRLAGQVVLASSRGREWLRHDFESAWRALVPNEIPFEADWDTLAGLYVELEPRTLGAKIEHRLTYFPASELPLDPAQRFAKLFERKEKWTPDQMKPFLDPISPNHKATEALLLKFTRTQNLKGQRLLGSRIK